MSAIKTHFHDQIEAETRMYNIPELQKMNMQQLTELAKSRGIQNIDGYQCKQIIIYEILNDQAK